MTGWGARILYIMYAIRHHNFTESDQDDSEEDFIDFKDWDTHTKLRTGC